MKTMTQAEARTLCKAISRHVRRHGIGRVYGRYPDHSTWSVVHPQLARTFQRAAEILTQKTGGVMRFMPRSIDFTP